MSDIAQPDQPVSTGDQPIDTEHSAGGEQLAGAADFEPAPAPAPAVDLSGVESRLSNLESRVTALESRPSVTTASWTGATGTTNTAPVATSAAAFDSHARYEELIGQGVSEQDATEQAAYEERLWNDQHTPAPAAA